MLNGIANSVHIEGVCFLALGRLSVSIDEVQADMDSELKSIKYKQVKKFLNLLQLERDSTRLLHHPPCSPLATVQF